MSMSPRPARPVPSLAGPEDPPTTAFSAADIDALGKLLREDARKHAAAAAPPPKRSRAATKPPPRDIGHGLTVVLVALIVALAVTAVVFGWLILSH